VLAWASERISADLRNKTYAHMQGLSLEFFGGKRTGDLISRVSSDTDRICYFLSVHLLDFANDVLMLLLTTGFLVSLDPVLTFATLLPLPLIAFLVHRARSRLRRGFALGSRAWSEMTSVLADTIPGIRVVKAFAQERREVERFRQANDRVLQANDRVNTQWAFFGPIVALLTSFGLALVWGCGSWRIFQRHLEVGGLVAFVGFISRFYGRLDSMSRMVSATQRAGASAQRIFAILDRIPSVAEPVRPVHPGRLNGTVEFREVGFHYGARPVLRDVSLKVQPGEMIGLVGPSGAGKTTIVNLVCRFYDVTEGALLVDGTDIRSFPIEEYRRHIGIVLQEPFLFYGTIAENIAYGRPNASHEEMISAARAARAHDFILRLPDGYDSLVGERGQFLSGGERQRISIARALLIDPRILILDEATSSVDTETEREIQLALENLVKGRTTIAIAHRLSTLRRADRLVVIERGRVTEVGHHSELVDKGGTYSRLYHAQYELSQGKGVPEPETEDDDE
jgi:ATP-binding cassette subfamily B protein